MHRTTPEPDPQLMADLDGSRVCRAGPRELFGRVGGDGERPARELDDRRGAHRRLGTWVPILRNNEFQIS